MPVTSTHWGATAADWRHFGPSWLALTPDLLPVVSNPHAEPSPDSQVKQPGKVPTEYNRDGKFRGLAGWTDRTTNERQLAAWAEQPDYGICLQTRTVRAIDVDITDDKLAAEVWSYVCTAVGHELPERRRANSPKFLLGFTLPGELTKRKITTAHGIIEFLANGQQFVAVGTHPSGARYEWTDGLPVDFPELSAEKFEAIWQGLADTFGIEASGGGDYTARKREADVALPDPLADHLRATGRQLRVYKGALVVACPWESEHSSGETGDGSTVYYPAGTRGYEHGAFKCLHGHCTGRSTRVFARAVGFTEPDSTAEADFGDLDDPEPARPTVDPEETPVFDPNDYPTIAAEFWRRKLAGPASKWRKWHGVYYGWGGDVWNELDADSVGVKLHVFLTQAKRLGQVINGERQPPAPFRPTKKHLDEVLTALRSLILLDADRAPTWARGCPRDEVTRGMRPEDIVSLSNGLFHVPTAQLIAHTPAFFSLNALPFAYDPHAECPHWREFLATLWADDSESIQALQEMVGYMLTADTRQQKLFMLQGPPRAGKGLIARVITELVGRANVAGPSLRSITTQFGLAPLIGKLVAIIGDARSGGPHTQQAIETLLGISGEDTFTIDRKNRDSWDGKLAARVLILSNETLSLPDASGALTSRMVVLRLTKSFLGREDTDLEPRLIAELPGIFRWALEGRARLAQRGYFVQPKSSRETIEQMVELNSPIKSFVEECCELGAELAVPKAALYSAYRAWCTSEGMAVPSAPLFSKNLFAAFQGISEARPRTGSGPRARHFTGIRVLAVPDEFGPDEACGPG